MFLASAGRTYSHQTPEEEFKRYLDCDVIHTLRAAIIRLYELPIKPINLEEFFAEYIEDEAREIMELSMLRAELCYKKSEAQDLMKKLESLSKETTKESKVNGTKFKYTNKPTNQYEVMKRFLENLQEFPPGLFSTKDSIIFKRDEKKLGGEGEGVKSPTTTTHKDSHKDSILTFMDDLKRLDPWGIVFPEVHQHDKNNFSHLNARTEPTGAESTDQKSRQIRRTSQKLTDEERHKYSGNDLSINDDSKSLAELYHQQQQNLDISDNLHSFNETLGEESLDYHKWDIDYWKQFFKTGSYISQDPQIDEKLSLLQEWSHRGLDEKSDFQYSHLKEGSLNEYKRMEQTVRSQMSPASNQYELNHNVWTAPKFLSGEIPFHRDTSRRSSRRNSKKKTKCKIEPDVIDNPVEDPIHCGASPVRTYSKALSQEHQESRVSITIPHTPTPSRVELGQAPKGKKSVSMQVKAAKIGENEIQSSKPNRKIIPQKLSTTHVNRPSSINNNVSTSLNNIKRRSRKSTGHVLDFLEDEESQNHDDEPKRLSKIAKGFLVIPNYEGDGPKQIPHDYESDSEYESGIKISVPKLSKGLYQHDHYKFQKNSLSSRESDCSHETQSTVSEFKKKKLSIREHGSQSIPDYPCLAQLHPYPELLTISKQKSSEKTKRDSGVKFLKFFKQHYDKEVVDQLQRDYDFSIFEGML